MSDRHYRSLADKSGAEFDRAFVSMMVDDHKKEVKMFQKEANDAADPDVRSFASGQVSTLQQHLDRAQSLMNTVGK